MFLMIKATILAIVILGLGMGIGLAQSDYDNGYYQGLDENRISPSWPPAQASSGYQQGYDAGADLGTEEREEGGDYKPYQPPPFTPAATESLPDMRNDSTTR